MQKYPNKNSRKMRKDEIKEIMKEEKVIIDIRKLYETVIPLESPLVSSKRRFYSKIVGADRMRAFSKIQKSKGRCIRCDASFLSKTLCEKHLIEKRLWNEKRRDEKMKKGICLRCDKLTKKGSYLCQGHIFYTSNYNKMRYRKKKDEESVKT